MTSPHRELGLTDPEYDRIVELMGREPNQVELAIFSLMWSEHCGYKHSRKLLKTLPTEGPRVVMGPGENAGAVDVGGGLSCAFKVESHNHPSAVEPFQGAATGVGGILRDVFAVGARPIAVLDSLRFGEPGASARSRYLLERAVAGIGHYGNSIGVATVGGEIYFEPAYEQNCLVNAMCLGLIETEKLIRSAAAGVGNVVVLFGARTGRDGIGGASVLASAELGDEDASKRPTVQIGDPFEEAKLLECSLELLDRGLLVALQDLGAAGLTSSSSEMAAKGEVGLDLDVTKVPLREAGMEPFEIMISESQERMLCVVEPGAGRRGDRRLREVGGQRDGDRRGHRVAAAARARRRRGRRRPARHRARGRVPGLRPRSRAAVRVALRGRRRRCWATTRRPRRRCARCSARPTSPRGARSSSSTTRSSARGRRGAPSRRTRRCSCSPTRARRGRRSPWPSTATGAASPATRTAERSRLCSSARPTWPASAPSRSASPTASTSATRRSRTSPGSSRARSPGLGDACRALGVPVVGGNVSLYNEGGGGPIFPTPVVGMVGELPDAARAGRLGFAQPGDAVARDRRLGLGAVARRLRAGQAARRGARGRAPGRRPGRAAHPARRGAPGGALGRAELGARRGRGRRRRRPGRVLRRRRARRGRRAARATTAALFGEGPGAFVASGPREAFAAFGAAATVVGTVGGDVLRIAGALEVPVAELAGVHADGLAELMR